MHRSHSSFIMKAKRGHAKARITRTSTYITDHPLGTEGVTFENYQARLGVLETSFTEFCSHHDDLTPFIIMRKPLSKKTMIIIISVLPIPTTMLGTNWRVVRIRRSRLFKRTSLDSWINLKSLNHEHLKFDKFTISQMDWIIFILVSKLDSETVALWAEKSVESELPTLYSSSKSDVNKSLAKIQTHHVTPKSKNTVQNWMNYRVKTKKVFLLPNPIY